MESNKIFKTKIKDFEILEEVVLNLLEHEVDILIEKIPILKKYGLTKKKNYDEVRVYIKSLVRKNKKLRDTILNVWNTRCNVLKINNNLIENITIKGKVQEKFLSKYNKDMLEIATYLWRVEDEQLNAQGDAVFNIFKEKKEDEKVSEEVSDEKTMVLNKNSLDVLDIDSCINSMINIKNDLLKNKAKLEEQDKVKVIIEKAFKDNRDIKNLKKEITKLSKKCDEITENYSRETQRLEENLKFLKKDNESLKEVIRDQTKEIKKININKNIQEVNLEINSSIKGLEEKFSKMIAKNQKEMIQIIQNKLNDFESEIKNIKITEKNVKEEIKEKPMEGTQETNINLLNEISSLLD